MKEDKAKTLARMVEDTTSLTYLICCETKGPGKGGFCRPQVVFHLR